MFKNVAFEIYNNQIVIGELRLRSNILTNCLFASNCIPVYHAVLNECRQKSGLSIDLLFVQSRTKPTLLYMVKNVK